MYSKSLFILMSLVFLFVTEVHAQYQPWIERQLKLTHALNDTNLTQEKIVDIINKEKSYYDNILEDILLHKTDFLNNPKKFDKKTFSLEHMINLNKRMGNKYAVLRDEVLVKSYKLITYQNQMVRKIFQALDYYTIDELEAKMSDLFAQNQIDIRTLEDVDYKPYLAIKENNSILHEAQKNIKDFYALIEINADILRYLSTSDKTMYRLNKYAKYNLLPTVLFIQKQPLVQMIDPWLGYVGLDVVKVLLISRI